MTRLTALIAPPFALMLAGCSQGEQAHFERVIAALTNAPMVPDYVEGSEVIEAVIVAEPEVVAAVEQQSSEPVYVPTAHLICDPDWEWRGVMQPGACHNEYW